MAEGSRVLQYSAALCITFYMIFQGIILGWPSPVIPKLLANETDIVITEAQCSWVVALVTIGGLPGCVAAQYIADTMGRRKALLSTSIPAALGSIMILFGKYAYWLYVARILVGFAGGMVVVITTIYITEIADKDIRGSLGTLIQTMANIGNLMMYCIGPFVSYNILNLIVLTVPFVGFLLCFWIPESPYYQLKQGNITEAEQELKRLKGVKDLKPLEVEVEAIKSQVRRDMERKTTMSELFCKKEYRKAVIVVAGLKVLQQMTGSIVIQSYLETIFHQAHTNITRQQASIIYGVVQFFAGIFATLCVDKIGRKPLLTVSTLGTGVSTALVGIFFYMLDGLKLDAETMSRVQALPLVGILGFNIFYIFGIGNLPYLMQAELFPTNVKSAASSAATMGGAILAFIVAKSYQDLVDLTGKHTVFWMFSAISFLGAFFIFFVVPETKGKSLQEIQDDLHKKSRSSLGKVNGAETRPLKEEA